MVAAADIDDACDAPVFGSDTRRFREDKRVACAHAMLEAALENELASATAAVDRLCDPAPQTGGREVDEPSAAAPADLTSEPATLPPLGTTAAPDEAAVSHFSGGSTGYPLPAPDGATERAATAPRSRSGRRGTM